MHFQYSFKYSAPYLYYILSIPCSYTASLQDIEEGTLRMHRKVTSKGVKNYASHIPGDEVEMTRDEDIEYKQGILTHCDGTMTVKLMRKV